MGEVAWDVVACTLVSVIRAGVALYLPIAPFVLKLACNTWALGARASRCPYCEADFLRTSRMATVAMVSQASSSRCGLRQNGNASLSRFSFVASATRPSGYVCTCAHVRMCVCEYVSGFSSHFPDDTELCLASEQCTPREPLTPTRLRPKEKHRPHVVAKPTTVG